METSGHAGMRRTFEAKWSELANSNVTSKQMVDVRLEETGQCAPQAYELREITSIDTTIYQNLLAADVGRGGTLPIRKSAKLGGKTLAHAEELRLHHKLLFFGRGG